MNNSSHAVTATTTIARYLVLTMVMLAVSCVRLDDALVELSTAEPDAELFGAWECVEGSADFDSDSMWLFIGKAAEDSTPWRLSESVRGAELVSKGCMTCEVISFGPQAQLDRVSFQFVPVKLRTATYFNIPTFSTEGKLDHSLLWKYSVSEDKTLLKIWFATEVDTLRSLIDRGVLTCQERKGHFTPFVLTDVRGRLAAYLASPAAANLFSAKPIVVLRKVEVKPVPNAEEE